MMIGFADFERILNRTGSLAGNQNNMEELMKRTTIVFALMTLFVFASISSAQNGTFILTFSGQTTYNGSELMTIRFNDLENTNIRLLEAVIPMTRDGECSQNTDFSRAVPIGPDRASIAYDQSTGTYKVKWLIPNDQQDTCRMLGGDGDVDGRDFLIWRRAYGSSGGIAEIDELVIEPYADATIRVHYDTGYGNRITIRGSTPPMMSK
jgi:hypothetical protein